MAGLWCDTQQCGTVMKLCMIKPHTGAERHRGVCLCVCVCIRPDSSLAVNVNKSIHQLMILMIRHGYAEAPAGSPAKKQKVG